MQLTYRGQTYQSSSAIYPIVSAEQEVATTNRGIQTTTRHYQFQTTPLQNPNWRTMRFLGKRYAAQPNPILNWA